jgi:hypothetical protein
MTIEEHPDKRPVGRKVDLDAAEQAIDDCRSIIVLTDSFINGHLHDAPAVDDAWLYAGRPPA